MYPFCRDKHTSYCSFTYYHTAASHIVIVQLCTLSYCSLRWGWILMGFAPISQETNDRMLFLIFCILPTEQPSCTLFCCQEACIANSALHSINFWLKLMARFAFGRVQYGFNFFVTSNIFIWLAIIHNRLHDITLLKTVFYNCCTCLWGTIRLNSIIIIIIFINCSWVVTRWQWLLRQTILKEGDCYYLVMSFCILKTFSIPEDSYFKTLVQMSPNEVL
jgi:hypothetical protein